MDGDGVVTDPYGGQADLDAKILRHVSPHFVEDPLRVLRVARFAARYHHLGFVVAEETQRLMAEIVAAGELTHLSTERVWVETEKALGEKNPEIYCQVLYDCGALQTLMPEVAASNGIPALTRAAPHTPRASCRWAALLAGLPRARAQQASERLKARRFLAARVALLRPQLKAALKSGEDCMTVLKALDALRREEPFGGFCETLAAPRKIAPTRSAPFRPCVPPVKQPKQSKPATSVIKASLARHWVPRSRRHRSNGSLNCSSRPRAVPQPSPRQGVGSEWKMRLPP